jgi:GT2 family glycosyltransferase
LQDKGHFMDISIIIVSWNAKDYLDDCLNSIIQETIEYNTKIIVVDNASSDGSPEMVQEKYPSVTLICNQTNLGFAKANNVGIKQSTGEYIFLINSDVTLISGCINQMIAYMEQHTGIGILGPKILDKDRKSQRSCMEYPTLWNVFCRTFALDVCFPHSRMFSGLLMKYWSHDNVRSVDTLNGCFWMVRRDALNQVGLLDERFFIYGEDIDWCKRFRDAGWDVVFFPGAQAIHYGGASSSNAPVRFYVEMQRANLQLWKKHHKRVTQLGFTILIWIHQILRVSGYAITYAFKPRERITAQFKIHRSMACMRWMMNSSKEPLGRTNSDSQVNGKKHKDG